MNFTPYPFGWPQFLVGDNTWDLISDENLLPPLPHLRLDGSFDWLPTCPSESPAPNDEPLRRLKSGLGDFGFNMPSTVESFFLSDRCQSAVNAWEMLYFDPGDHVIVIQQPVQLAAFRLFTEIQACFEIWGVVDHQNNFNLICSSHFFCASTSGPVERLEQFPKNPTISPPRSTYCGDDFERAFCRMYIESCVAGVENVGPLLDEVGSSYREKLEYNLATRSSDRR